MKISLVILVFIYYGDWYAQFCAVTLLLLLCNFYPF